MSVLGSMAYWVAFPENLILPILGIIIHKLNLKE